MMQCQSARLSAFQRCLTEAARIFGSHHSGIGDILASELAQLDIPDSALPDLPMTGAPDLSRLLERSETALTGPLVTCSDFLRWRKPGFGKLPERVSTGIDVVEIAGPDGMLKCDNIRFGLLVQNAGHFYPDHNHAAEELYYILSGAADWSVNQSDPGNRKAGSYVHHEPWQMHSMKTGAGPMLAMWGWTGKIAASAYQLQS